MREEKKKKTISKKKAMIISVLTVAVLFGTAYVAIELIKKNNINNLKINQMTKEEQLKYYTRINEQESY